VCVCVVCECVWCVWVCVCGVCMGVCVCVCVVYVCVCVWCVTRDRIGDGRVIMSVP
jgi:hypothetical protein